MVISGSLWRKAVVTVVAVGGFVSLYEVTTLDSRYAARQAGVPVTRIGVCTKDRAIIIRREAGGTVRETPAPAGYSHFR